MRGNVELSTEQPHTKNERRKWSDRWRPGRNGVTAGRGCPPGLWEPLPRGQGALQSGDRCGPSHHAPPCPDPAAHAPGRAPAAGHTAVTADHHRSWGAGVQVEVCSRGTHLCSHRPIGCRALAVARGCATDRQTDRHQGVGRQGLCFARSSVRSSLRPAPPPRAPGADGRRGGIWGSPGRRTHFTSPRPPREARAQAGKWTQAGRALSESRRGQGHSLRSGCLGVRPGHRGRARLPQAP